MAAPKAAREALCPARNAKTSRPAYETGRHYQTVTPIITCMHNLIEAVRILCRNATLPISSVTTGISGIPGAGATPRPDCKKVFAQEARPRLSYHAPPNGRIRHDEERL